MHSQTTDFRDWLCIWRCLEAENEVKATSGCIAKPRILEIGYAFGAVSKPEMRYNLPEHTISMVIANKNYAIAPAFSLCPRPRNVIYLT